MRMELNKGQRQAVDHRTGPMLVVAGAGTGKTRVIVERIIRLIEEGVDPSSILALTFTEKAAGEMLDRVNESRGGFSLDLTIATYNGFGDELLKKYAAEIGLGNLSLLGETGQLVFLRQHLDELGLDYFAPISKPDSQLDAIASYISKLKQQLIRPVTYLAFTDKLPAGNEEERLEKLKHRELAHVYGTYIALCRRAHVIDYDDQLFLLIELLEKRPNIKAELQKKYQYVLVDEFQDTNPVQSRLLDLLANAKQNIMTVGDDDQSIYGWRGATLANILDFKKRYPKTAEVTLIENYRSTQPILDSAYQLIQHNNPNRLEVTNNLDKRLHANIPVGPEPSLKHFASFDGELNWIAEDIARRLKAGQEPGSIAVLARRNQGVQRVHEALELHGIAHAVAGLRNNLYQNLAVAHLLEALQAIDDPLDNMALFHCLSGPLFNIHSGELSQLATIARREHVPLTEVITDGEAKQALEQIEAWRERSAGLTIGQLSYEIITESGWKGRLYAEAATDDVIALQVQAINQFFGTLKEFERISTVASLQSYVLNLPTLMAAGNELQDVSLEISDSQVNVLSVHRAKGLEWQTVYIADCTEGSFPMGYFGSSLKVPDELKTYSEADNHMAEERRLMYVATTRAQIELILTYSDTHNFSTRRRPSRFLPELFGEQYDTGVLADKASQTSMELFAPLAKRPGILPLPPNILQDGKIVLNVSQITCWLKCPQDFYYCYVLQMPLPENPTLVYGILMHSIIQQIHEGVGQGRVPTLESLVALADEKLPSRGYLTKQTRERARRQAIATIGHLFERFSQGPLPSEVEKSFRIEIPDTKLIMTGRIDAVYDLGGGKVEIRDYKTGTTVRSADKAKQRATSSSQLSLYALAWQLQHNEMPGLLTLDFVETNFQGSIKKQAKSMETLRAKLAAMVKAIEAGKFDGGTDHTHCSHPL